MISVISGFIAGFSVGMLILWMKLRQKQVKRRELTMLEASDLLRVDTAETIDIRSRQS
jgi:hypothetical protein